ncbi:hypothetical protein MBSD_n1475 [Mizugakiibacter sediminis]|uniref:Sulfotransferase n=1 Tax=Mizugakiibacter sediminis TaxID=1475481 RepID=A0A0K8QP29_9GAMM|nr:sulfotransferase [Mizugakiibacter sediminis]GAP66172.1 hypothetical protein MBSD_n1475 [Mizugakiibacter sediminis]
MSSRLQGLSPAAARHVVAAAQALDAGRADAAGQYLAAALAAHPQHPEVLRLQAGWLSLRGQHAAAVEAMQRALAQRRQDPLYHNTLGSVLAAAGEFDRAVAALRRACELQPGLAIAWYNLGVMLIRCVRHDAAADALRRAVALAPDNALARTQLADMLRVGDRVEEAEREYRRVLAERPWTGMAWWGLADLKTLRFSADDVRGMQQALQDPRASDDDRIATGFALAKACDDEGRCADALAALQQAHALARRRQTWDASAHAAMVDAIQAAFAPPPAPAADAALGREVVFIAGLPRSGTTLVEQILASHSAVEGAGELPDLPLVLAEESHRRGKPYPQWAAEATPVDWERLGRRYLERTAHWRRRRAIFTDKLPNNWLHVGAIRAMLPAARIVCCRRDPLETCFSCYRQHLANNEYARTFADLAAYWRDYDRSVSHWSALHPSHVHVHGYEALLEDPAARIRALLDFCGLPFEEACLHFHRTRRDVRSPSATQVRQPLRRDTARAPRYGALLDPLRSALGMPPAPG